MNDVDTAFFVGRDESRDQYRLVRQVGGGGEVWQAEVYTAEAWQPVAVKILAPEHLDRLESWKQRWLDLVETLRFARHPGVVGVRDGFEGDVMHPAGQPPPGRDGRPARTLYLVMNWVQGRSFEEWVPLHRGDEGTFDALRHLGQVASTLDWLHSGKATPSGQTLVHGDVKPANVIITPEGQAVLVDFGLSRVARRASAWAEGAPGYRAPEVLREGAYSAESDRYAFAGVVFSLLTGEHPPEGYDPDRIRERLARVELVRERPGLLDHLMTMFAPTPTDRRFGASEWLRVLHGHDDRPAAGPDGLAAAQAGGHSGRTCSPPASPVAVRPRRAPRHVGGNGRRHGSGGASAPAGRRSRVSRRAPARARRASCRAVADPRPVSRCDEPGGCRGSWASGRARR
ncbi:MAG: serine/threonine protein kinase [Egibacteraceae bacterium]